MTEQVPHWTVRKGKVVTHHSWKWQVVGGMWVHWSQKGTDPWQLGSDPPLFPLSHLAKGSHTKLDSRRVDRRIG